MKETSEMPDGSVNLNDEVWVQLTDLGWKVYDDFHSDVPLEQEKLRALVEDPSGWQKFQLWSLMEIYGPHTHHGMDSGFFERLELRLQQPDQGRSFRGAAPAVATRYYRKRRGHQQRRRPVKTVDRHGRPKAMTIYEATAALGMETYGLLADIARNLRAHALAENWAAKQREMDADRRRWRRDVMGRHYDGL